MKTYKQHLAEGKESIYGVRAVGNFYNGRRYEQSVDTFWVLATSPAEAEQIAKDNIASVTDHFKRKKLAGSGKTAMRKNDTTSVRVGKAKATSMKQNSKVLTNDGKFTVVKL